MPGTAGALAAVTGDTLELRLPRKERPQPPEGVCEAALGFWRHSTTRYDLTEPQLELLRSWAHMLTRAEEAAAAVAKAGVLVPDRFGVLKPNPAVDIERKARTEARACLREIGFFVGDS